MFIIILWIQMKNFSSKALTIQHEYGKLNACTYVCFWYHHNFCVAYTGAVLINTEELEKWSSHDLFPIFYLWSYRMYLHCEASRKDTWNWIWVDCANVVFKHIYKSWQTFVASYLYTVAISVFLYIYIFVNKWWIKFLTV